MKKSEKIEIRISYAEKESLVRLAESEGYSVSELVRGLARKYAQLNMPRSRRKLSTWHMAGLIMCGIGIGSGLAFSLGNELTDRRSERYMVHGTIDDQGFSFGVIDNIDHTKNVILGDGTGAFKIDVTVKPGQGDHSLANFFICKQTENSCIKSAQAGLDMSGGNSPSVWQTNTETGEKLFLVLQPVSG